MGGGRLAIVWTEGDVRNLIVGKLTGDPGAFAHVAAEANGDDEEKSS
ncbi:MAG: hypothetical protein LC808_20025 [Actinobacteria bacterium]|nr:hypothetical protein [Actinomycetota bacterium]